MPEALTIATALVNDAAQDFKETGHAVNLVQNDQLVALGAQKAICVVQAQTVGRALQIQVNRARCPVFCQFQGQRGLAHLPRTEQHRSRCFM